MLYLTINTAISIFFPLQNFDIPGAIFLDNAYGQFPRKFYARLFRTYILGLYFLGARISAQNLLWMCWWNWHLVRIFSHFIAVRTKISWKILLQIYWNMHRVCTKSADVVKHAIESLPLPPICLKCAIFSPEVPVCWWID